MGNVKESGTIADIPLHSTSRLYYVRIENDQPVDDGWVTVDEAKRMNTTDRRMHGTNMNRYFQDADAGKAFSQSLTSAPTDEMPVEAPEDFGAGLDEPEMDVDPMAAPEDAMGDELGMDMAGGDEEMGLGAEDDLGLDDLGDLGGDDDDGLGDLEDEEGLDDELGLEDEKGDFEIVVPRRIRLVPESLGEAITEAKFSASKLVYTAVIEPSNSVEEKKVVEAFQARGYWAQAKRDGVHVSIADVESVEDGAEQVSRALHFDHVPLENDPTAEEEPMESFESLVQEQTDPMAQRQMFRAPQAKAVQRHAQPQRKRPAAVPPPLPGQAQSSAEPPVDPMSQRQAFQSPVAVQDRQFTRPQPKRTRAAAVPPPLPRQARRPARPVDPMSQGGAWNMKTGRRESQTTEAGIIEALISGDCSADEAINEQVMGMPGPGGYVQQQQQQPTAGQPQTQPPSVPMNNDQPQQPPEIPDELQPLYQQYQTALQQRNQSVADQLKNQLAFELQTKGIDPSTVLG